MTVIAVGSIHGPCSTSTLALDLARMCAGGALLIEADPDGGCLAARLDLAVRPGLTELAGAARGGIAADDLWRFAQPVGGGVGVIVAHPAAEQVNAALRAAVHHVGAALPRLGIDAVIDLGRLRPGSPALGFAALADRTIVLVDNCIESVIAVSHRTTLLTGLGDPLVVLGAAKPYGDTEVAQCCGQPVWGVIPQGDGRRSRRRRAVALAQLLVDVAVVRDEREPASMTGIESGGEPIEPSSTVCDRAIA